jgi:hypothetical protein
MKRKFQLLVPLFLAALVLGPWTTGERGRADAKRTIYPKCVMIIRHAEKPPAEAEDVHLSKVGQERAEILHRLFVSSKTPAPFPTPDFIFATHDSDKSHRPGETVKPLAMKLKLPIDQEFHNVLNSTIKKGKKAKGIVDLKEQLFTDPKYAGKTILISWHHGTTPELARELRVTNAPAKWDKDAFDRVWRIGYDDQGKATFADMPQRLMPGDSPK